MGISASVAARLENAEGTVCVFGHSSMTDRQYKCKIRDGNLEHLISFTEACTYLWTDEMRDIINQFKSGVVPRCVELRRDGRQRGDVRMRLSTDVTPNYSFNTRQCAEEDQANFAFGVWLFTPHYSNHWDTGGRLAGWPRRDPQHTGCIKYLGRMGDEEVSEGGHVDVEKAFQIAARHNASNVVVLGCKSVSGGGTKRKFGC